MSRYDWETATLTLPSAEVAPLKKALRDSINTLHDLVRAEAVRLHKSAKTTNVEKYAKAVGVDRLNNGVILYGQNTSTVRAAALQVLGNMIGRVQRGEARFHVPTVDDVSAVVAKKTNKDNRFDVIDAYGSTVATITFEDRTVRWDVEENNHAVEHAHEADLAKVFFGRLDKITWTRATGGYGVGNDEYNEGDDCGQRANYTTFHYGPLGEEQKAREMGMTLAKYREFQKQVGARRPSWGW